MSKTHDPDAYDNRHMRFYRWISYSKNKGSSEKWVEYNAGSETIRDLFSLEPGRMVWLKTLKNVPLHLDSAYTLSLKDTFTLELPALEWTDFGMPYRFSVRLEEILSASGISADSVLFYRWKKDSVSKIFSLEPLFVPGIPDRVDRSSTIDYLPAGGYSFYNSSGKKVLLRIPPTLDAMAKKTAKIAIKHDPSWSAKFVAKEDNGAALPCVYFGYSPGIRQCRYPLSPTFATLRPFVYERKSGLRYGHSISEDAASGLVKELQIANSSDSLRRVQYCLEAAGAFPEDWKMLCYDAAAKSIDTAGSFVVKPQSISSRWIIVGDAAYREHFFASIMSLEFTLQALYPNPSRSTVNIRYIIPFGAQERIKITIYNVLGKKVWEKRIDDLLYEGPHIVPWNGQDTRGGTTGSGIYIVRLSVIDQQGKVTKRFDRRVTRMK